MSTLSTVGYGDVAPATATGRIFASLLIIGGVGTAFYLVGTMTQLVVEGTLRNFRGRIVMERQVEQMTGHVIVCGFGRFGRVVVDELEHAGMDIVVVDREGETEAELQRRNLLYLIAEANEEGTLARAGIDRARALVISTPSDADNVFITLAAREKNPSIPILARGETEAGIRRLELAGATRAISAYHDGARRMAASLLHPSVVDFLQLSIRGGEEVALEEVTVSPTGALAGKTVVEVEALGARLRVVGVRHGEAPLALVPKSDHAIVAGDLLVVIGARQDLAALAHAAGA